MTTEERLALLETTVKNLVELVGRLITLLEKRGAL